MYFSTTRNGERIRIPYFSIKYALDQNNEDHSGDMQGDIVHRGAWDKASRFYELTWDILIWAFDKHETGQNLVVILSEEDKEFVNIYGYSSQIERERLQCTLSTTRNGERIGLSGYVSSIWRLTKWLCKLQPDVEVLGMERLKIELQSRGLKCGGTLQERAERLFLLKSTPLDKLPKTFLAKRGETKRKKILTKREEEENK